MNKVAPVAVRLRWKAAAAFAVALVALSARPASAAILSIPTTLTVTPGGTVSVPVNLTNVATTFTLGSYSMGITFNNALFTSDIPVGGAITVTQTVNGVAYTGLASNINNGNGTDTIFFAPSAANPANLASILAGSTTDLFDFNLTAKSTDVPGTTSPVTLDRGANNTYVLNNQNPAMDQLSGGRVSDGLITIVAAIPEPSQVGLLGLLGALGVGRLAWGRRRRAAVES
jgi:hypothetical protein